MSCPSSCLRGYALTTICSPCARCKIRKTRCEIATDESCKSCQKAGQPCVVPGKKAVPEPEPESEPEAELDVTGSTTTAEEPTVSGAANEDTADATAATASPSEDKPRIQSEAPAASPPIDIMTHSPSAQASPSPAVKMRSPSPISTVSRRGRKNHVGARGGVPRAYKKVEPMVIQAAQRSLGTRRKAQRHTDAFGVKLPEILRVEDQYDYELPEDIVDNVPRMTDLSPDGSPSEDRASESEEALRKIPDLLPLSSVNGSEDSNFTTRNVTPAVRTIAPPPQDPESDEDL